MTSDCSTQTPTAQTPTAAPPRRLIHRLFAALRNLLACFGLMCLVYFFSFDLSPVVSDSMAPTLKGDGKPGSDWLLSEKWSYRFRAPRRWEVVYFLTSDHLLVAKRVAGLPGEKISLKDKKIFINGAETPFPPSTGFLTYYAFGNLHGGKEVDCGPGYFLLGDDSRDSQDSRFEGPVSPAQIRGRACLRVWPWHRVGFISP